MNEKYSNKGDFSVEREQFIKSVDDFMINNQNSVAIASILQYNQLPYSQSSQVNDQSSEIQIENSVSSNLSLEVMIDLFSDEINSIKADPNFVETKMQQSLIKNALVKLPKEL